MKKICLFLLSLCLIANLFSASALDTVNLTSTGLENEKKIICTATETDNFSDDCVIVVLKKNHSLINKKFDTHNFGDIGVSSISDLTYINGNPDTKEYLNRENFHQVLKIKLKKTGKKEVLKAIKKLEKRDDVLSAEPNYTNLYDFNAVTINDPLSSSQYALNKIQAYDAWEITTGSRSVQVGIMDTGIDISHPDLAANIKPNVPSYYTGNAHGTTVAGIVGAVGNNGIGISGVCQQVTLYPMEASMGTIEAIVAAINDNVPVVNMSFGGGYSTGWDYIIGNYTGLAVCGAGNNNVDNDITPFYPASLAHDNIISVATTDSNDNLFASNYGATSVDLAAPGWNILSTSAGEGGGYSSATGTSCAAPFVSGVVALIKSKYPFLTSSQIKEAILNSVDKISSLSGKVLTGGRLNAYKALQYCTRFAEPISTGVYKIKNVNSGFYLDVPNASTIDGTQVKQYKYNGNANQQWQVTYLGDGSYTLRPMHCLGSALEVSGDVGTEAQKVDILSLPSDTYRSCQWKILQNSDGSYRLMSASSGFTKALVIQNASLNEGGACVQFTYNASRNDMWIFEKVTTLPDGVYAIKNVNSGFYLDVPNASTTDGTQVKQYKYNGNANQLWQVKHLGDGTYAIRPTHCLGSTLEVSGDVGTENQKVDILSRSTDSYRSGQWKIIKNIDGSYRLMSASSGFTKALAIQNDLLDQGGMCVQRTYTSQSSSWSFEKVETSLNGVYAIKNVNSGLYLDVPYASTTDGTQIEQHYYHGSENQKWRLTHLGSGIYVIRPMHCLGSALDVFGDVDINDQKIDIWSHPTDNYRSIQWLIIKNDDGTYRVMSSSSQFKKALVILQASLAPGGVCVQYPYNASRNDMWIFEQIS